MALEQGTVTSVPPAADFAEFFQAFLTDAGSSDDLVVNGSGTPVVFKISADVTLNTTVLGIIFVFTAASISWGGNAFGQAGGALTNGVLVETDLNATATTLGNLKVNEDFLHLPHARGATISQAGNEDVISMTIDFGVGIVLSAGSADEIRVTVRDNLTFGTRQIDYFKFSAFGTVI